MLYSGHREKNKKQKDILSHVEIAWDLLQEVGNLQKAYLNPERKHVV